MCTINTNPAAEPLIAAWMQAKDNERQWAEHRRNIEDQILSFHPRLLEELQEIMLAKQSLSVTAKLDGLLIEARRSLLLKQEGVAGVLQEFPDLWGPVLRAKYEVVSSKAAMGLLAVASPAAEALRKLISFRAERPYFTAKPESGA